VPDSNFFSDLMDRAISMFSSSPPAPTQQPLVTGGTPRAPMEFAPKKTIPFSPSYKYTDRNWKQESMPEDDIKAIAASHRTAVSSGLLPKELGDYLLPIAMVENRPGNMGINPGDYSYSSSRMKRLGQAELTAIDMEDPENRSKSGYDAYAYRDALTKGKRISTPSLVIHPEQAAKMMA